MISESGFWQLFRHLKQWLSNLRRASDERKRESVKALRAVVVAARGTGVYLRKLDDTGQRDHAQEARLSQMWTELGFVLVDLGLAKLAKRCDVSGRYWADPDGFEEEFLDRADIDLARMEQLARQMVAEVEGS